MMEYTNAMKVKLSRLPETDGARFRRLLPSRYSIRSDQTCG